MEFRRSERVRAVQLFGERCGVECLGDQGRRPAAEVVDGKAHIEIHVVEGLGEVAGLTMERIAVQQQHRHGHHGAQQRKQQQRVGPVQVEIAVTEPDVHLQRQAVLGGLMHAEGDEHRAVDP